MALQRCILATTRQYLSKRCILQSNLKPTYCELYYRYSSDSERRYTDRHEWISVDNDIGTVGISKYAQDSLGDVVFAQLPETGVTLTAGDECGALESVKAASEIYSPVSGKVLEKNKEVETKPALINTSCYEDGWLFRLQLTKPEELKELMTEQQYETFLKTDVEKEH
ncbi:glycine cleavage system H protein, mitochondrial-like [Pectinophora gossypiella]|uniref:glycine cleavage system H protein, mitochondrial-like n=1 Tax=Pectinophora gossypiella TaxID=13191 RepID=UPI00214E23D5|nr:glycine cleavage system H protein, mitochondrial-like [Pectinophora gossypiella]XP_049874678.1 glycine cleavage system H protein, mitochondrial-like [Pectinophora gossypiella]XP_049874679.1 glycine cleavage system H protein, mitochondrial-like [Pectinophora gossypiella]